MKAINWYASIDGHLVPENKAQVSILDRGYLYGDGIFDTLASYRGRIFKFEDHMERLEKNSRALGINPPLSRPQLQALILKTLKKNRLGNKDAYIRVSLSRGKAGLGPAPLKGVPPGLTIITRPLRVYPVSFYKKGVEILTVPTRRLSPRALDGKIKSLNYLNSILAREGAHGKGLFEAVLLSEDGYVTEGTASNIFITSCHGKLITPPSFLGVLEGITRKAVLEIARSLGIATEIVPFTTYDLYTAEECFLTGSIINIMPVRMVDKRIIGTGRPGPMALALRKNFLKNDIDI